MKHIIDEISPEFDELPAKLRESHNGSVLLEIDRRPNGKLKGIITIGADDLLKEADQVVSNLPPGQEGKLFIELIADNQDDEMGHRKYAKIYEELTDIPKFVAKLDEKGIDKAKLKQKFKDKQK